MPETIKSLKEFFTTTAILEYIRNYPVDDDPSQRLFPDRRVESLKAEWEKSMNNLPVMANFVGTETEANLLGRDELAKEEGELGFIKVKRRLSEKDIIERYFTPRLGTRDQQLAIEALYNDIKFLIDAIRARCRYTKIQVMANGKAPITIRRGSKEVTKDLDYGIPASHQAQPSVLFDNVDAKPLNFFYDMAETIAADSGQTLVNLLTTGQVINFITSTNQIKEELYGTSTTTRLIGLEDVNSLLVKKGLAPIYKFKGKVRVENADGTKSTIDIFPAKKLVGIPGGILGEGLHGPTAEERKQNVKMTEVDMILAYLIEQDEPPAEYTKAVTSFLPTFPAVDAVYTTQVIT